MSEHTFFHQLLNFVYVGQAYVKTKLIRGYNIYEHRTNEHTER